MPLTRFGWLAVAAAVVTIALKTLAWALTGSVGLLSDALESVVNLVAAVLALVALQWAAKPPDEEHAYGHAKAEYVSAAVEGAAIFLAALSIGWAAVDRLLDPKPLEAVGVGLGVAVGASLVNLAVGALLLRAGRRRRSIALDADGRHLLTDVWTSLGVVAGVGAVALTGWGWLDPVIALAVAANILVTGARLVRRSTGGLMDRRLPAAEREAIEEVLSRAREDSVRFHALRTRRAARLSFLSVRVLVPGAWTVQRGHDEVERIEEALHEKLPYATLFTHLEPAEDPRSFADTALDRARTR